MVIKAKRRVSISDLHQNTHLIHLVICIVSSHLLASCYSQLLVNTVSLAVTLLSICLDLRTDPCLLIYRLMAECEEVAIRVLCTPDGRYLGTLDTLLNFHNQSKLFPMKYGLNWLKKNWIRARHFWNRGFQMEGARQHQLQSCSQRTSRHGQRQVCRQLARQDQPQSLGRHSRCRPVLRCPKHSRRYGRSQQPKRESLEQALITIGVAVLKKSSPHSAH